MTRLARGAAVAWLCALGLSGGPALADELEYPVKVEFIERFTRFIVWPPEAFRGADGTFALCLLGETPAQPWFERLARERRIQDRRVDYKKVKLADDLGACHLLFIAAGERARLKQVLQRA